MINHRLNLTQRKQEKRYSTKELFDLYKDWEALKLQSQQITNDLVNYSEEEKRRHLSKTLEIEEKIYEIEWIIKHSNHSTLIDIDFKTAFKTYLGLDAKIILKETPVSDRLYLMTTYLSVQTPSNSNLRIPMISLYENQYDYITGKENTYGFNIFKMLISLNSNTPFFPIIKEASLQSIQNRISLETKMGENRRKLILESIKRLRAEKEEVKQNFTGTLKDNAKLLSIESQLERAEKTAQELGIVID